MTNWEKIQQFDKEHMIKFLADISQNQEDTPWLTWFNKYYCSICDTFKGENFNFGGTMEYSFCEINHYCKPYFILTGEKVEVPTDEQILNLWLKENMNDKY